MKKILVLIGMLAMISVSSFANQSCPIRNSPNDNIVNLMYSEVQGNDGKIEIPVELAKPSEGETSILVEVRDSNGKMIGTANLTVSEGKKANYHYTGRGYQEYSNTQIKSGQWYSLSIARATCIAGW